MKKAWPSPPFRATRFICEHLGNTQRRTQPVIPQTFGADRAATGTHVEVERMKTQHYPDRPITQDEKHWDRISRIPYCR